MYEQPLFPPECEAVSFTAVYDHAKGWRLVIHSRLAGQPFSDADRCDYSHLSGAELLQVVSEELCQRLAFS